MATALIILLIIGALSGSWMISEVVPTLIYYGMQIIHPSFFLASTCIICAIVSVMTGSSWTTIATIGIALLESGRHRDLKTDGLQGRLSPVPISGDKISPLSDTTVLASSVTDTPLFKHIKYMMITTVPSMIITLTITYRSRFKNRVDRPDRHVFCLAERDLPYFFMAVDRTRHNRDSDR